MLICALKRIFEIFEFLPDFKNSKWLPENFLSLQKVFLDFLFN
jgi:hypothetical protein